MHAKHRIIRRQILQGWNGIISVHSEILYYYLIRMTQISPSQIYRGEGNLQSGTMDQTDWDFLIDNEALVKAVVEFELILPDVPR